MDVTVGADADRQRVLVSRLERLKPTGPTRAPPATEPDGDFRRPLGWTLAAAGVAGIAIGSYFGLRTFAKKDESKQHCVDNRCDATGLELGQEAESAATASTFAFGAGLAGLGAGLWLLTLSGEF
jgi:hypothetical protein